MQRRGIGYRQMRRMNLRKNHPIRRLFLNILFWFFGIAFIYIFYVFITMPSLDSLLNETREPVITFIDRDGYEIQSRNQIMGDPVSVKTLPKHVWLPIVAIEDKRFFQHSAIDMRGILRSIFANARSGRVVAGGSTITQQTAKNIFLNSQRTVRRKIQELLISFWLEHRFSKHQILDLYLNRVSLSRGMRGIDAAARNIFGKSATDLTLAESAQLAAMLKAPTTFNPALHPEKNIPRAKVVLVQMFRQGMINKDQLLSAASKLRKPQVKESNFNSDFRYWTDFAMDNALSQIGSNIKNDIYVYTTLDADLQKSAAASLRAKASGHQGAIVAINRKGEIVAMVGGMDYQQSQFNRALAMRQPGSTFKPAVYLVAIESGMNPSDMVEDSAFAIGDYNPKNYNEKYYGSLSLADAFAKSVNSVPLKLTYQFGLDNVLSMAARLGVGAKLRRDYSTVLGTSEMTPLDLTTMYATIWNGGYSMHPFAIRKITTSDGKILYDRKPSDPIKLLKDETVSQMKELLYDVVRNGTGRRAFVSGKTIGGKTGTSANYRDAWFVGATSDLTIGIWVGNDDYSPMDDITGGSLPAEIFKNIIAN